MTEETKNKDTAPGGADENGAAEVASIEFVMWVRNRLAQKYGNINGYYQKARMSPLALSLFVKAGGILKLRRIENVQPNMYLAEGRNNVVTALNGLVEERLKFNNTEPIILKDDDVRTVMMELINAEEARESEEEKKNAEHKEKMESLKEDLVKADVPKGWAIEVVDVGHYTAEVRVQERTGRYIQNQEYFSTVDEALQYAKDTIVAQNEAVKKKKDAKIRAEKEMRERPQKYKKKAEGWKQRTDELKAKDGETFSTQIELAKAREEFYTKLSKVPFDVEIVEWDSYKYMDFELKNYPYRIPANVELVCPDWADRLEVWQEIGGKDPLLIGIVEVTHKDSEDAESILGGREFFELNRW